MATQAGVGMSAHRNPIVAGREAAAKALEQAGIATPDFVFLFASVGYNQQALLSAVREATGRAPLVGCSAEGTIAGDAADESNFSVVVMTIASDELRWRNGITQGLQADSDAVGQAVAAALQRDLRDDALGLFVFPDGLTVNFDRFQAGLERNLGLGRFLPLWGGAAGDNLAWEHTYQYCDDQIVSDGVAYALMAGSATTAVALTHGCIPIGSERTITRADGNVIYEIDHKPVLNVIEEYFPDQPIVERWPEYVVTLALCFRAPAFITDDQFVVRAMPSINPVDGSVTVQTEARAGASVWMSSRDGAKIAAGLDQIAADVTRQLGDCQPKLVFQFDCGGRGKQVFREQEKLRLLRRLRLSLSAEVPWIGFYTFGEIGPVGRHNSFHNYTAVVLAIC